MSEHQRFPQLRLRRIFRVVNGGTPTADPVNWDGGYVWVTPEDLGASQGRDLTASRRTLSKRGIASSSATVVPAGSIILSTRAPIGHVKRAAVPMATNQGCRSLVQLHQDTDARFFCYALEAGRETLQAEGRGTTFLELSANSLASFSIPVPPPTQQRAIADYLDSETERMRALLAAEERLVELLWIRCRREINLLFSGGSEFVPLRRLLATERDALIAGPFGSDLSGDDVLTEGPCAVLDQGVVIAADLSKAKHFVSAEKQAELERFLVRGGDIVISGRGTIGAAYVVPDEPGPAVIHPSTLRIRPNPARLDAGFLHLYIKWSDRFRDHVRIQSAGATIEVIYAGTLKAAPVPRISIDRQLALSDVITGIVGRTSYLTQRIGQAMDLLRERRGAVIKLAVNGQLDTQTKAA